jgi:hypothetical protein
VTPETATQKLASHLLGRPVNDWIAELREAGWTYRAIADQLAAATYGAVDVTPEAIRLWTAETAIA